MPKNVEIKARVLSESHFKAIEEAAAQRSANDKPILLKQSDCFFQCEKGRMKLRTFESGNGELIWYQRPDAEGPKCSDYIIVPFEPEECKRMRTLLSLTNKVLNTVDKERRLYIIGQTRVHIDRVSNLGLFVELEVVLRDDQTLEYGEKVAQEIADYLTLKPQQFIAGAYVDLLPDKS